MNWLNTDNLIEEEKADSRLVETRSYDPIREENERKIRLQLKKFQLAAFNPDRQVLLDLVKSFGDLISQNMFEEIARSLFMKDCKIFIFGSGRNDFEFAKYGITSRDFIELFKDQKFVQRKVLETYVDLEKSTVCEISICKIMRGGGSTNDEISSEVFTIKGGKVVKYRVSFGLADLNEKHGLGLDRKDKMVSIVNGINNALAGKPDFQKVAAFLHETTEYKIWTWEKQKCFILRKEDFENSFKNLQENFIITQIVPFEVSTNSDSNRDVIVGTYTYHLEPKNNPLGQKFIWLSTSIYAFDQDVNISKISQQGELYSDGEVPIPFTVFSKEEIIQKSKQFFEKFLENVDLLYSDTFRHDCVVYRIGSEDRGPIGGFKGVNFLGSLVKEIKTFDLEWIKVVDIFIDQSCLGYETAVALVCGQGKIFSNLIGDQKANGYNFIRLCFENGKVAKVLQILTRLIEPIPSPFDDTSFSGVNINSEKE